MKIFLLLALLNFLPVVLALTPGGARVTISGSNLAIVTDTNTQIAVTGHVQKVVVLYQ